MGNAFLFYCAAGAEVEISIALVMPSVFLVCYGRNRFGAVHIIPDIPFVFHLIHKQGLEILHCKAVFKPIGLSVARPCAVCILAGFPYRAVHRISSARECLQRSRARGPIFVQYEAASYAYGRALPEIALFHLPFRRRKKAYFLRFPPSAPQTPLPAPLILPRPPLRRPLGIRPGPWKRRRQAPFLRLPIPVQPCAAFPFVPRPAARPRRPAPLGTVSAVP